MIRHPKYKINFNAPILVVIVQTLLALGEPLMILTGTLLSFFMALAIGGLFLT